MNAKRVCNHINEMLPSSDTVSVVASHSTTAACTTFAVVKLFSWFFSRQCHDERVFNQGQSAAISANPTAQLTQVAVNGLGRLADFAGWIISTNSQDENVSVEPGSAANLSWCDSADAVHKIAKALMYTVLTIGTLTVSCYIYRKFKPLPTTQQIPSNFSSPTNLALSPTSPDAETA